MFDFELLILAEMTVEEIGKLGGKIFWGAILLAALIKCFQIARRSTTNTLCVLSLACVLAMWGLSLLLRGVEKSEIAAMLIASIFMALALVSIALGILGLIDYNRHREQYVQGKSQALWGIAISSCLLLLLIFSTVNRLRESGDLVAVDSGNMTDSELVESQYFEDLNFRYQVPNRNWLMYDIKAQNPDATFSMVRTHPNILFMIIAEKAGVESMLERDAYVTVVKANLQSAVQEAKFLKEVEEQIGGIDGIRIESSAVLHGRPRHSIHWVAVHNGYAYQLVVTSEQSSNTSLQGIASKMFQGFSLIDQDRITHAEGIETVEEYESKGMGYRLGFFLVPDWILVAPALSDVPMAEFVARKIVQQKQVNFAVVPLELPLVETDPQSLLAGMTTHCFRVADEEYIRANLKELQVQGYPACEIRGNYSEAQPSLNYVMRLVRGKQHAYLLAGWWPADCSEGFSTVEEAMEGFEIVSPEKNSEPMSAQRSTEVGLLLNSLGIVEFVAERYPDAIKYFKMALKIHKDQTVLTNLLNAYVDGGLNEQALAELEKQLPDFPNEPELRAIQARLTAQGTEPAEALKLFYKIFAEGHTEEEDLLTYLNLAAELEAYEEALETIDRVIKVRPRRKFQGWKVSLLNLSGQHEEAIAYLLSMQEEKAFDTQEFLFLAAAYEGSSQFSAAIETCDDVLARISGDVSANLIKGRCELQLHKYAEAKISFQKVLAKEQSHAEARESIDYLSGLLGSGDNSRVRTKIEPVPIPASVSAEIDRQDMDALLDSSEYGAVELYRVQGIDYQSDKTWKKTTHRKVRIIDRSGIDRYSTLEVAFDPLYERVYVNQLEVRDATGKVVAEGIPDNFYVIDDKSSETASSDQVLYVPIPSLKIGSTFNFVYTRERLSSPSFFGFEEMVFSTTVPIGLSSVFVSGEVSKLAFHSRSASMVQESPELVIWNLREPLVYRYETLQRPYQTYLPMIWISDSEKSWNKIGQSYFEEIQVKLKPNEATQRLAAQLGKGKSSAEEIVSAMASYVQKECVYKAIEFGTRARMPNTAEQTLSNGYGDCKDHSVLLHQLLEASGVRSHLVLISSFVPIVEDLPSLDQFNHMIVYVPGAGPKDKEGKPGGQFLDCTTKETSAVLPVPLGLGNRTALLLDSQNSRLHVLPAYPKKGAQIFSDRTIDITMDKNSSVLPANVTEKLIFNTYYSEVVRRLLRAYEIRDRESIVRNLVNLESRLSFDEIQIENLDKLELPLLIKMKYAIPDVFDLVQNSGEKILWAGSTPLHSIARFVNSTHVDRRNSPFEIETPTTVRSKTQFNIPAGYEIRGMEKLSSSDNSTIVQWAVRGKNLEQGATLEFYMHQRSGHYAPNQYHDFHQAVQRSLRILQTPIELRKKTVLVGP